ncbi:MAG TPA: aldehyde dehydrogenase family protein [Acidimicrobiales bacterium]|nr:aldehyde dehydrogenase family protein [Acidimicrobiales bacterium]
MTDRSSDVFEKASVAFKSGVTRSKAWRLGQLRAIERLVREEERELLGALDADLGKPGVEAWLTDLASVTAETIHMRKHLSQWMRPRYVWTGRANFPGLAWTVAEPRGTVLVISPWNYPVNLSLIPLAAALSAGNSVVLKPSELTPATSATLARLVGRYLDREAVTVVEGGVDVAKDLLDQPFDHIFFTGSTTVGKSVMTAAAKHLASVTLELGGKCPVIVAEDSDVQTAARRIAWGKLVNSGQTCIAPDYVLVERGVSDELIEGLIASMEAMIGPDPTLTRTCIVNDGHLRRLESLLASSDGKTIFGGGSDHERLWMEPAIVVDPDAESELMHDEIFGPILPIVRVESIDDALQFVSARPKPLALYLFTSSRTTEEYVLARTSSGGVCINHVMTQFVVPELPFGGVGPSGAGAYHGRAGFEELSHRKGVLRRPTRPDPPFVYPPYGVWKERLLRKLL